jgi:hypothetical protein
MEGAFTASAFLVDCTIARKRKLELQLSSPDDLAIILGPSALDESRASVSLKDLVADDSAAPVGEDDGWPLDTEIDGSDNSPRKVGDGTKPLVDHRQEMVARFLAAPTGLEEFASVKALATHLKISRMTFYRWARDTHVLRRVAHLSQQNKLAGDLLVRREWPSIMRKAVDKAKSGDVQAMKFCNDCAWPKDSGVDQSMPLGEAIELTANKGDLPSWLVPLSEIDRREADRRAKENAQVAESNSLPE